MDKPRYEKFILLIDGIHKAIHKLKLTHAPGLGIKGVHIFWLCNLMQHPEGMTAAELATESGVDRSLISREIEMLEREGYVTVCDSRRYVLTEKGKSIAEEIHGIGVDIQTRADDGISTEELISFYSTLEKLHDNFTKMTEKPRGEGRRATTKKSK